VTAPAAAAPRGCLSHLAATISSARRLEPSINRTGEDHERSGLALMIVASMMRLPPTSVSVRRTVVGDTEASPCHLQRRVGTRDQRIGEADVVARGPTDRHLSSPGAGRSVRHRPRGRRAGRPPPRRVQLGSPHPGLRSTVGRPRPAGVLERVIWVELLGAQVSLHERRATDKSAAPRRSRGVIPAGQEGAPGRIRTCAPASGGRCSTSTPASCSTLQSQFHVSSLPRLLWSTRVRSTNRSTTLDHRWGSPHPPQVRGRVERGL
jgi:hypothetical protein